MGRFWRVFLLLLVITNLTLVCQGHDSDGHHTGVHLALFGEPGEGEGSDVMDHQEPGLPASNADISDSHLPTLPIKAQHTVACTTTITADFPSETANVITFGLAVFVLPLFGGKRAAKDCPQVDHSMFSQTHLQPDSPPPR